MLHVPASRLRLRLVALLSLAVLGLVTAGCGSSSSSGNLLSRQQASDLRASLSQVEQDVSAKNCTAATDRISQLQQQIDSINGLDGNLRSSLTSSVRRLETLVNNSCQTTSATTPTTPSTGSTGASGATGATGTSGQNNGNKDKAKKQKGPKNGGPGQGDGNQPGQGNGGGGAGVPGESNGNGNGGGN